jgi:hypothetical protein
MKLKTALKLSLVVNAIFVVAVGYMLAINIEPKDTQPLVIYTSNAPAATPASMAMAPQ